MCLGQLPVLTDEVDCAFCGTDGDRNKVCVDNACTCQDGFYLGGALGDTCLEAQLQEPPRTAESVGAVIGTYCSSCPSRYVVLSFVGVQVCWFSLLLWW